jgi:multicomponent Na+:H+ antiporter subunit C
MTLALMITISLTVAAGVLLLLSRDLFRTLVGLAVLGGAVNLAVFLAGRPGSLTPPIIPWGLDRLPAGAADPLPQALVLTAIVIGFALLCFALVLGAWISQREGHGAVDRLRRSEPPAQDPLKPPILED